MIPGDILGKITNRRQQPLVQVSGHIRYSKQAKLEVPKHAMLFNYDLDIDPAHTYIMIADQTVVWLAGWIVVPKPEK